eukprot:TRINITY_DN6221_c0_g2_i3.p1 TRINITY_DN6221_c0_g2~~TRINITY_DN6221_c0_g2_i3.p1  ORF type:complete len:260 (-),score=37.23 TRINITY_DN6221_c0_g2_i3:30-809(-)
MVEYSGDGFFDVILTRGQGTASKLGVVVASGGEPNLLVTSVDEEGLIASWNASMSLWQEQVHVGDRFCEVNGVGGDGALMLKVLVEQQELRIRAKKALPSVAGDFEVRLDKTSGADLGLQVELVEQTSLKDGKRVTQGHLSVITIDPGIVSQYNSTCPLGRQIAVGDQIVSVNGESRSPEMMLDATKHKHVVVLNIKRTVSRLVGGDLLPMQTKSNSTGSESVVDLGVEDEQQSFIPIIVTEECAASKRAVCIKCCLSG